MNNKLAVHMTADRHRDLFRFLLLRTVHYHLSTSTPTHSHGFYKHCILC